MKLYITLTSPYARMARAMVLEKGLAERVEPVEARTREAGSPYYQTNPSGRIPYLICDDGLRLEESALICAYLDRLEGVPAFEAPPGDAGWRLRALEALARSLLDGLAVWGRELRRPEDERSPTILRHEAERSQRLADCWEEQIDDPLMQGPFNMAQLTLICALDLEIRNPHFRWRDGRPRLAAWADRLAQRPSLAATVPPPIL